MRKDTMDMAAVMAPAAGTQVAVVMAGADRQEAGTLAEDIFPEVMSVPPGMLVGEILDSLPAAYIGAVLLLRPVAV